ncbi:MAG: ParB family transcriptional regulator, chromosome partitioning protein [Acidobacteriota bacterium]|nr:ParB family transcriptional regulator, chromosome partitioning protein [Acidobacteriota bacterium]
MSSSSKKRGLGRGLDALLAPAPPADAKLEGPDSPGRETVDHLPIGSLKPNRFQPRTHFDEPGLDELAESIRTQGIVQPLVVTIEKDGTYSIIAGERRFRAAQRAGLTEVPVVVRQGLDDRARLELALVENLQRADLNPLEEAEAYQTLQEAFGLSQEEVAGRVGKARPTVANALRLLKLPEEIRELLREGRLTAGQARPLLGLASAEEQVDLALRAVRQGLSAREIERLTAGPRAKPERPAAPAEVHAAAAAETLTRRLQTRVEIRRKGKGGRLELHFHSEEELIRLYELLMEKG